VWSAARSVLTTSLAVAALVLFLAWMGGAFREKIHPGDIPTTRDNATGRPTAIVEKRRVIDAATAVGSVQPRHRTEVSAQLLARILDVKVRPGDAVMPKQELILLDDRELFAQHAEALAAVTGAEADLLIRKSDFARAQAEREKGIIGVGEYARFEGALKVAEAQVKRVKEAVGRLEVQLSYTKILANSRGVVADRFADPGDVATPGKPLLLIYDPAELELHVNVPESLAPEVREGQELQVEIEAAGVRNVAGVVREIVPQAQQASRTVLVKLTLPRVPSAKPLLPGMFGRVAVPIGTVDRLFVPRNAVRGIGQLDLVEVVGTDGLLNRRFVRVGPAVGEQVEILSGLAEGESVALPPR
jgi:RND family efflux transporter MFP subunit